MRNKSPVLALAVLLAVLAAFLARRGPPPPTSDQQTSDQRPLAWAADDAPLAAHPSLATHLREGPRGLPWVLEYSRPLVPADRAAVAATGAHVLGYIPPRALLLEAPPASRDALAALPGVAASAPLPPYRPRLRRTLGKLCLLFPHGDVVKNYCQNFRTTHHIPSERGKSG